MTYGQPILQWQLYGYYKGEIRALLDLDTAMLAGAESGFSCINSTTNQASYYNSNNSGLAGATVLALAKDPDGSIWIGTECSLILWNNNVWTQFTSQNSILTSGVSALRYCPWQNALYAGCMDGRVIKIDVTGWSFVVGTSIYSPVCEIRDIEVEQNGNIWVVVSSGNPGLYRYDGTDWFMFNVTNTPLLLFGPISIDIDSTGSLWVITGLNRLLKYDGNIWTNFGTPWPGATTTFISCEENNTIWISTSIGIVIFDGTSFLQNPINQQLINTDLLCHYRKKNGEIWMGTRYSGVFHSANLISTHVPLTPEMESDDVKDIAFDKQNGKVWFATSSFTNKPAPACYFNDTVWYNFDNQNCPINPGKSTAIAIDVNSKVHLGCLNEGLWVFQNNIWTN